MREGVGESVSGMGDRGIRLKVGVRGAWSLGLISALAWHVVDEQSSS